MSLSFENLQQCQYLLGIMFVECISILTILLSFVCRNNKVMFLGTFVFVFSKIYEWFYIDYNYSINQNYLLECTL